MSLQIKQQHPLFVGEVSGIDLARPLSAAAVAEITEAIDRYAVLVFHGQQLDDDSQLAFARHFGAIEPPQTYSGGRRLKHAEFADVSNLDPDNRPRTPDDRRRMGSLGNRLWHTDASFRRVPGALSMLYAHRIPAPGPKGDGETEFTDLRAAYDALPDATKQRLEPLVAEHSVFHSRSLIGFSDFTDEERAAMPPVPQRVVRRHPGSQRKTLYLAAHASHIVGWPVPDGMLLLRELIEHATQPEFVHTHRWQAGDLVIWDNRCTMHRGRRFDETQPRDLRRITTQDVASTLDQAA
ncbi:MAG TPA: TauD/TfdA family dioxygenase [Stellaceae bacterium]|jgi:alpha-ketoglutarate-dependent 2,4-dichlorophenoxyacetate dioxygenase|nr:TauD/TfdA family dioxygenase [Stellaceae bacterium]